MPPGKAEHNKRISGRALWFAGLAVLLFWANTAVAIKPTPPVELDIAADETALGIGQDAAITLFVSPLVDIEAARVEFATGVGDAAITGPTTLNLGALAANESYTAQTTITLTGQGKSEVRGYIYALDAAGRELFWRSKALLLVASDGNAVTGKGGFMPLELEALRLRRTAGTLAKSAYTA
ncbi:MAG TPA: hypothetical protein HPP77_07105, partial [Candidatus Hydrogenedentes bacterium]|nr:hypothetical protein [Candidatus Hydrogenedentota bacterium]